MKRFVSTMILLMFFPGSSLRAEKEDPILSIFNQINRTELSPSPDYSLYDPFANTAPAVPRPVRSVTKQPLLPRLGAIIQNQAFLDGRWVKMGEKIRNYRLISVTPAGVILERAGKHYRLTFRPPSRLLHLIFESDTENKMRKSDHGKE